MSIFILFLLFERQTMLEAIKQSEDAMRDNLKAYHYKNEEVLYQALLKCEQYTKPTHEEE